MPVALPHPGFTARVPAFRATGTPPLEKWPKLAKILCSRYKVSQRE